MGLFTDIYNTVAKFFRQSDEPVIGDASNVGNLRTVIWGAWDVCMKL